MLQLIHTCDIARKQAVGTNGRKQVASLATNVPCLMLPLSNSNTSVSNGFDLGRPVEFFFNVAQDVQAGDRLTVGSNSYTVQSVQTYNVPQAGHVHVIAQQEVN